MNYASSGCHELKIAGPNGAAGAGEVFVVHGAFEEVGDCLLASVWVVWETGARRDIKVVKH
jgi:uncharacterized protein (UPF0179 family)